MILHKTLLLMHLHLFLFLFTVGLPGFASPQAETAPNATKDILHRSDAFFAASNSVRLIGTVIWNNSGKFVLKDATGALLVMNKTPCSLVAGDKVDIICNTSLDETGERFLDSTNLVHIGHEQIPSPNNYTLEDVRYGHCNYQLVRTSGIVTDIFQDEIDPTTDWMVLKSVTSEIMVSFGFKDSIFDKYDALLDAEVSVIGICLPIDMGRRRFLHPRIELSQPDSLTILRPAARDPFAANQLNFFPQRYTDRPLHRCRISGTVLATWQRSRLLLRTDDGHVFRVRLRNGTQLPPIDTHVSISGFVEFDSFYPEFVQALVRNEPGNIYTIGRPVKLAIKQLFYDNGGKIRINALHNGQFVSLEGIVRNIPNADDIDKRLYLESDGMLIAVDIGDHIKLPIDLYIGCRAQISGICLIETERTGEMSGFSRIKGISIIPRTSADIVTLSRPSWWTSALFLTAILTLAALLIATLLWNASLRKLAERRSLALFRAKIAKASSDLKIQERTRLSVELHDSLSQNLTGISFQLDLIEKLIDPANKKAMRVLNILSLMLQSSRNELRSCIWDLRNQALDEPTIENAIRNTLQPYLGDTKLTINFMVPRSRICDNTMHAILRIIRELTNNAIRHGKAKSIYIAGDINSEQLLFSVQDDGTGFDSTNIPGAEQGHFGIDGIKERVRHINGCIQISSAHGQGTKVTIAIGIPRLGHKKGSTNV